MRRCSTPSILDRARHEVRRREIEAIRAYSDAGRSTASLRVAPNRHRLPRGIFDAELVDQDLDARLVDVVAASVEVVHAQDRLDVGQQVLLLEERPDLLADIGRAAHAAADQNAEAVAASGPRTMRRPMSWKAVAARSSAAPGRRS